MRVRKLLALLLFPFVATSETVAQQKPDPTQDRLAIVSHIASLTHNDLELLSSEARSGNPEAQYWLAMVYEEGRLVAKDARQFEYWLVKSAEQGLARRDRPASERWLLRAAEQGDPEAQFLLGDAYEENWYGTTDNQVAAKWYEKAAAQGHPDAQVSLAQMYEDGRGVELSDGC